MKVLTDWLQAWNGFYGNVYFEPIVIEPLPINGPTQSVVNAGPFTDDIDNDLNTNQQVFRLSELFYHNVVSDLRSSPPWLWSTDFTRSADDVSGSPRFDRSVTNVDRSQQRRSPSNLFDVSSPRSRPFTTNRSTSSIRRTGLQYRSTVPSVVMTQRERFEAASASASSAALRQRSQRKSGSSEKPSVGFIVAASANKHTMSILPDPPELSSSVVDQTVRRCEPPFDRKRIRRGRAMTVYRNSDDLQRLKHAGGELDPSVALVAVNTGLLTGAVQSLKANRVDWDIRDNFPTWRYSMSFLFDCKLLSPILIGWRTLLYDADSCTEWWHGQFSY